LITANKNHGIYFLEKLSMKFQVIDFRYITDKGTNVMYATNDKHEAIFAADEIGSGTLVVRNEDGLIEIVYRAGYKTDLGLIV
jgi:hypothetical protein